MIDEEMELEEMTVQYMCDEPYAAAEKLFADVSIFEALTPKERKRVFGAIKRVRPRPEFKEDFAWLRGYMKEIMESDNLIESGSEPIPPIVEEIEVGAEEFAAEVIDLIHNVGLSGEEAVETALEATKVDPVEGLSPDLQAVISFIDEEIRKITAMVDRNNYQTARRVAFRAVRDQIIPPAVEAQK